MKRVFLLLFLAVMILAACGQNTENGISDGPYEVE